MSRSELRFPALEIRQGPKRRLYSFAVDGKILSSIASISRVQRDSEARIAGYQRPEVVSHIAEIRRYLESSDPLLPNAIVVAFDKRVRFEPADVQPVSGKYVRVGTLIVPSSTRSGGRQPGWIVDGQQRTAALRDAELECFPVAVTAFIADSDHEQKEQFILVNSTKPLPKGLIYELLPTTKTKLPSALQRRRFPAYLLDCLNYDEDSPFCGLIQTPTNPEGVVKDNSILKLLENSLTEGVLHDYRDPITGAGDSSEMLRLLKAFWRAVREVFPDAWGVAPRKSRLMHGAGIVSMGFIMDAIADIRDHKALTEDIFDVELRRIANVCRWTAGTWEFARGNERRWNEIQNTPKDIQLLTQFLLGEYRRSVSKKKRVAGGGR